MTGLSRTNPLKTSPGRASHPTIDLPVTVSPSKVDHLANRCAPSATIGQRVIFDFKTIIHLANGFDAPCPPTGNQSENLRRPDHAVFRPARRPRRSSRQSCDSPIG
jgi:hypothetical protein